MSFVLLNRREETLKGKKKRKTKEKRESIMLNGMYVENKHFLDIEV